jgi:hypothetical protein
MSKKVSGTILETNKLIAEFMGQLTKENNVDFGDIPFHGYCLHRIELSYYHTSWDWLIPVVHKCLRYDNDWEEDFSDAFLSMNIDKMYDRVVNFIGWYNENNQK